MKIYLLTDYRGQFYSSTRHKGASVDLARLSEEFSKTGHHLVVRPFADVDFRKQNYKDQWVLYQTSEDPGLFYKDYIEDIILGLKIQGAKLIPSFEYFRAHHNKNFMEILRDVAGSKEAQSIKSWSFGTFEEYKERAVSFREEKYVIKLGSTVKSKGVALLSRTKNMLSLPKRLSKTFSFTNLHFKIAQIRTGQKYLMISNNRRKFIIQEFIPKLAGDYRVVVYGDKYYSLYRENRDNDFRASGSMKFHRDFKIPEGLFGYARRIFQSFDTPFISLDIGYADGKFHLFEFQFLCFGQYTLEKSTYYHTLVDGDWQKVFETPDLEREITNAVIQFIKQPS